MSDPHLVDALPLRPAVLHILLVLCRADAHGLGIAAEVERASGGALELGPGTLYRSLKEMTERGLIREAAPPGRTDPRRKYYAITPSGRALVSAEAGRLARLVETARELDVLPESV